MVANLNYLSPEEYLALERKAEYKSEYVDGAIYAMAGGSRSHHLLAGNMVTILNIGLKQTSCEVYGSDMKLRVPGSGKFFYPDVTVACGNLKFHDEKNDTLLNPILLVEVLSESTAANDRGKRFQFYQEIESFGEYLLVSQDEPIVERFVKQPGGDWLYTIFAGMDEAFDIVTIGCRLELKDLYAKVF
ncbi:MAG: Uma2 family endonuclease [Blastocatellia bacterium]